MQFSGRHMKFSNSFRISIEIIICEFIQFVFTFYFVFFAFKNGLKGAHSIAEQKALTAFGNYGMKNL